MKTILTDDLADDGGVKLKVDFKSGAQNFLSMICIFFFNVCNFNYLRMYFKIIKYLISCICFIVSQFVKQLLIVNSIGILSKTQQERREKGL